jgi:hypothetical protein
MVGPEQMGEGTSRGPGSEWYVALAVDLYQGKVTADPYEARKFKRGLRQDRAIRDLKATFALSDICLSSGPP